MADTIMKCMARDLTPIEIALSIDEEGYTTARRLYEWLELDPGNYSRWLKANILDNPYADETEYSSLMKSKGRGQMAQDYRISASLAKRISMASHSERGEQARVYFIGCEQALVRLVEQTRKTEMERAKGIAIRQALTKAIQLSNENDRMHGHAYSTYTDVVYKAVFGKTSKQLRDEFGIGKNDSLRDCFTEEELRLLQNAEMLVSSLVNYGWEYDAIKEFVLKTAGESIPRITER